GASLRRAAVRSTIRANDSCSPVRSQSPLQANVQKKPDLKCSAFFYHFAFVFVRTSPRWEVDCAPSDLIVDFRPPGASTRVAIRANIFLESFAAKAKLGILGGAT